MDNIRDEVELGRLLKTREQLDMMWPYTMSDMILRHEHRKMKDRCLEKIYELQRRLGYMGVYPIVDGTAREPIFEGSPEACQQFVKQHKEIAPEDELIVLSI